MLHNWCPSTRCFIFSHQVGFRIVAPDDGDDFMADVMCSCWNNLYSEKQTCSERQFHQIWSIMFSADPYVDVSLQTLFIITFLQHERSTQVWQKHAFSCIFTQKWKNINLFGCVLLTLWETLHSLLATFVQYFKLFAWKSGSNLTKLLFCADKCNYRLIFRG